MEELLQLKKPELQKLADDKGIEYNSKTTNAELAEMIHAKDQNESPAQAVAKADESNNADDAVTDELAEAKKTIVILGDKNTALTAQLEAQGFVVADLTSENAFLKDTITNKDLMIEELKAKNTQLELRDVATGLDLTSGSDASVVIVTPLQKTEWNGKASMKVRVRVALNKCITSRIRSGMQFGTQYSEHDIDETTFNALIADSHLQVEALDE